MSNRGWKHRGDDLASETECPSSQMICVQKPHSSSLPPPLLLQAPLRRLKFDSDFFYTPLSVVSHWDVLHNTFFFCCFFCSQDWSDNGLQLGLMGLLLIFYPQIFSVDDKDRAESLFRSCARICILYNVYWRQSNLNWNEGEEIRLLQLRLPEWKPPIFYV